MWEIGSFRSPPPGPGPGVTRSVDLVLLLCLHQLRKVVVSASGSTIIAMVEGVTGKTGVSTAKAIITDSYLRVGASHPLLSLYTLLYCVRADDWLGNCWSLQSLEEQ